MSNNKGLGILFGTAWGIAVTTFLYGYSDYNLLSLKTISKEFKNQNKEVLLPAKEENSAFPKEEVYYVTQKDFNNLRKSGHFPDIVKEAEPIQLPNTEDLGYKFTLN